MRKHDVRKWLHAILDLLPVILIPVFMIYSHRHDVSQDFVKSEEILVYYETNEVTTNSDLQIGNIYYWNDNWSNINNYGTSDYFDINIDLFTSQFTQFQQYNVYECRMLLSGGGLTNAYVLVNYTGGYNYFAISSKQFNFIITSFLIDKSSIPSDYIDCISSSDYLYVKEYQEVITNIPHDVMTSFMDRFNNSIDEYFNMGNVFNLGDVYGWFNSNIFGGNAPTVIYSIWNIALYEFVMDLLFLLYGLFMWFIDMVQKLMEKPLNSVR